MDQEHWRLIYVLSMYYLFGLVNFVSNLDDFYKIKTNVCERCMWSRITLLKKKIRRLVKIQVQILNKINKADNVLPISKKKNNI